MSQLQFKDIQNYFPPKLALGSFLIGTLFLILHFIFPKEDTIIIGGFLYVAIAFLINGFAVLILFFELFINWKERDLIGFQMLILFANIPITALYMYNIFNF